MEHYNLVIVEDEDDIRNGITNVIDWDTLGFRVAGAFDNCKSAISFITQTDVDVVISDIVMPDMSGLDLVHWLKDNFPTVKTVLLSGYRDFSYAQQAIKFNVRYYMSKPTNIDELNEVFSQIKSELDLENQQIRIKKNQEKLSYFFQQSLFNRFLRENKVDSELVLSVLASHKGSLNITDYKWWICVCEFKVSPDSLIEKLASPNLKNSEFFYGMNDNNVSYCFIPLFCQQCRIYSIIWLKSESNSGGQDENWLCEHLNQRMDFCKKLFGYNLSLKSLHHYIELLDLIKDLAKIKNRNDLSNTDINTGSSEFDSGNLQMQQDLKEALDRNDLEPILGYTQLLGKSNGRGTFLQTQSYCMALALELRIRLQSNTDVPDAIKDENIYKNIIMTNGKQELIDYALVMIGEYQKRIGNIENIAVRKSKEYIMGHLCKNIAIKEIAGQVYLNPSYLSRLFKKETGENITDYILKKKMDQAKKYLSDPKYKVYQVCELTGYRDVRHFYKIFKKVCGLTPQEYRDKKCL